MKEVKIGDWLKEGYDAVRADVFGYALPALIIVAACLTIVGTLILVPLLCGFYHIIFQRMKGKTASTGDLFKGFDVFWDAFLVGIIMFVLMWILSLIPVLGVILGFLVGAAFIFVLPLIVDKRRSFTDAIRESFQLFRENWSNLILFYVIGSVVGALGALLFGVGIIFTLPIYLYATACLYRDWIGFENAPVTPK